MGFCNMLAVVINSTPVLLFGIVRIFNICNPNPCLRKAGRTLCGMATRQTALKNPLPFVSFLANNHSKDVHIFCHDSKPILLARKHHYS
jgi:hypothetical protein